MDQEKFLKYVQAENKVEPKDVMPDDYRKLLVRQISQHAHSGSELDFSRTNIEEKNGTFSKNSR